jgi:hypothetical protein
MIALFIRKEMHENLLNLRFAVAGALCITLLVASVVALTAEYEEVLRDYRSRVSTQEEFIDRYGHMNRASWMSREMRPPSPLQVLVRGIDPERTHENFLSNPLGTLLSGLDLVSIVTIVMSLVALLVSYDAITGEREAGVLRQVLAAGGSRSALLVGKAIGGAVSLVVPFTLGVLASLVWLALHPAVHLGTTEVVMVAALVVASWLCIGVFYGLGLWCSARSRTSGEAVLKALFAWVVLVLLLPNITPYLAAQVYPLPSAAAIDQERFRILDTERDEVIGLRERDLLHGAYADVAHLVDLPPADLQRQLEGNRVARERFRLYAGVHDDMIRAVNAEQRVKAGRITEGFLAQAQRQERLALHLTLLSPLSAFVVLAAELTETGLTAGDRWKVEVREHGGAFWGFVDERYNREKDRNPAFDSNDYLDLRERPRFHHVPTPPGERLDAATLPGGTLLIFAALFFVGALASFSRYDVR